MALASLLAASLVPLALVRHELVAAASYVVFCMCREAFEPAFEVLRMSLVPPQWHTRMASRVQSSMAFSLGLASIVGGHVIAALGYVPLFLGACALIAAAVLVLLATRSSIGSSRVARRPEHAA
jgi:predicted MFS family arabinose efflux permease